MSYSQVKLANLALAEVPAGAINAIDEASPEARACRRFYGTVWEEVVEAHDWRFAKKQAALAALATNDRSDEWGYAYAVPSDCLRPLALVTAAMRARCWDEDSADPLNGKPIPYDLQGSTLYTDQPDAVLRYVRRDVGPADITGAVAKAFYLELAGRLAGVISKSDGKQTALLQRAALALKQARSSDRAKVAQTIDSLPDRFAVRS